MDELRLAWEAHREGRTTRRDALLTLSVAGLRRDHRQRAKEIAGFLVASRPDHLFAGFERLDKALADPRVKSSLDRLRITFPPGRVRSLVARSNASRGPYTGRIPSIDAMIREMTTVPRKKIHAKLGITSPTFGGEGLGFPPDADPRLKFYLSTLVATATLFAIVLREDQDMRAA